MSRIRSLKPEAFSSESLAKVSVEAERTFQGLATIADDRGRVIDKPAQINGALWAMRDAMREPHTAEDLERELCELVAADGLVCRYTGCDGRRYLHSVSWDLDQKIDRPGKPKYPRCPHHLVSVTSRPEVCIPHVGECGAQEGLFALDGLGDGSNSMHPREISRGCIETTAMNQEPGGRVTGTSPSAGAKPRLVTVPTNPVAAVVAAYIDGATEAGLPKPAQTLCGRVGRQAKKLLREKQPLEALIAAAHRMGGEGWNDLAVQLQRNGIDANGSRPKSNSYQPWQNPKDQSVYDKPMFPQEVMP